MQAGRSATVVYRFENGWTVELVNGPAELRREGELMRNCLSPYHWSDWFEVLSIRDPKGRPQINLAVVDGLLVHGPKGKARRPLRSREQEMVDEFLNALGIGSASEQLCTEERRALDAVLEMLWYSTDVQQEESEGRLVSLLRRARLLPLWLPPRPFRACWTKAKPRA